jgi:hypothetical protein
VTTFTRFRLGFIVVLFTGAAVFLIGWAFFWLFSGSFPTATVMFLSALYLLGAGLNMGYVVWGIPEAITECGPEGTVIRSPKWADQMFFMSFASAVAASVLYLIFLPFGMIDFHLPEGARRVDIAICVFLIVFGAPSLFRGFVHGGESYLRLDSDGFEVWNGFWGSFVRGEWDDVEKIQDRPFRGRHIGREIIVFGRPKQRTAMFMSDGVTDDSPALLEWVRFYWQHPEYREELVDARALKRLSDEDVTTR